MRARSIVRPARSCMPQSQATATLPAAPSGRGTSFHPVPLHSVQFSKAIVDYCRGRTPARLSFTSLAHRIRLQSADGKQSCLGKLWKELDQQLETEKLKMAGAWREPLLPNFFPFFAYNTGRMTYDCLT